MNGDDGAEALAETASEVWAAMAAFPGRPTNLWMRAVELQADRFRDGSIRMTVEQAFEPDLLRLRRELAEFCEFARRLDDGVEAAGSDRAAGCETTRTATAAAVVSYD